MMSKFLVKTFVKNYKNIDDTKVRNSYGFLGSMVGILSNTILFIVKIVVGILSNSISVTADAFNNLSDVASSVITLIGFKLSSKPADKEHPFGHGRIEYISALVVSFMVILVGLEFVKTSYNRIVNPVDINFQIIPFILIVLSIFTKVWLSRFNKYIGDSINSSALQASSFDALSDVITSSCVALSLILSMWISFPIDGYIGIVVSLFIMYSGYTLIKETLNPLLGEAADPQLVKDITEETLNYPYIGGVHDLIVHNYGPGRCLASIHAEVPDNISIVDIHEIIDKAEKEISEKLNLELVIHMDPINTDNKEINSIQKEVEEILLKYPTIKSFHDFRVVGSGEFKNLIFDIVIDYSVPFTDELHKNLKDNISKDIKKIHPSYNTIITIDRDFTHI
ncbi:cation transporter [Clostridium tetani]|uniref:Cobalt-zinc-cadmium resistance protein czcD n=1 Tax=Clostridium tetani (strain Massachusetts / E88) TaxID=212717 RepID=Q891C2_CLOTE|nr:cation diffusion facilitator family transporter [Clostridium tetani]AAO36923.1 cobalt-zinc-cadmium resistance protein czcD [Clostridium tetani E88]AVP54580.1 cation transporter [Clostridium tetani]KGI38614.1 cation diffusion facilitator family transporter [Clostridium tetani]KGI44143.1 cation diffusion facilitator family transporter [Clostridium tetani]KHO30932.1 cation diffusion facilitator family transporter [Clostridium tetani]